MKYNFFLFTIWIIFISSCSREKETSQRNTYSIKDDLNNTVHFDSVPKRIITLAPNLTEMIYVLSLQDKLIGNTLFCNYPEEANNKAKVGDLLTVDFEKILSLKPDLVLLTVEGNLKDNFNKLKGLGFKLFVSNPRDFKGIKKTIKDISKIFRVEEIADDTIKKWDIRLKNLKEVVARYPSEKSIFFVGLNPIMAAGKNTFINELLVSAGLNNIAADSRFNYPVYSREQVINRNPDYILMTEDLGKNTGELLTLYPEWKSISAVKKNKIFPVNSDLYLRPGPRYLAALEDLLIRLHPEIRQENSYSLGHQEAVQVDNR